MFGCVVAFRVDAATGYLPLRKGQHYNELHRQTDDTGCWSYGCSDDHLYGWIPSFVVAPMFSCVVAHHVDAATGYLPLRKGQYLIELHCQTDDTGCWSYGCSDDRLYGWILSFVVALVFSGVAAYHADAATGHLPLRKGQHDN